MRRFRHPAILVFGLAAALVATLPAQDSVEGELRRAYELPLRWDNIEGAPEWVSGEKPERNLLGRRHEVELEPGESVCVRIPAYEWLRVVGDGGALLPNEVDIALSTGSGLLAFTEPVPDEDGESLLVDPRRPYPMLAHVMRPPHFEEGLRVALFTSRHLPLRAIASYRDLIHLGGEAKVRLTTSVKAEALEFWRWERGDGASLRLRGPARVQVQTRYRYPPGEQKFPQTYQTRVRDEDGATLASVEFATSQETAHFVFADGEAQVVGRLEPGFFDLAEDRDYHLTLETSAPVFVRLLRMEDEDYLLPELNAPDPRPRAVADALLVDRFQQSPWQLSEGQLRGVLANPLGHTAEEVERAAMRLARDNRRREGGMMASGLLWNAGAPRRDYPIIRERWREFVGFRTYYRDALPEGAYLSGLERAYFPARRLQAIGKFREWLVLGEQHIDAGFSRLPLATFSPIQESESRSIYRLPERATHSIIRVTAGRERAQATDFWLQSPGERARRFRLLPQPEVPWTETKPPQAEAALTLIEGDTLDLSAALRREPNNLVPAGYFEFLVPPHLRQIEIWDGGGAGGLPVAIQYRASDVYELSEDEYASVVSMLGNRGEVFGELVALLVHKTPPAGENRARRELHNHWEPLHRFVRSRYRQFVDSVAAEGSMATTAEQLQEADRLLGEGEYFLAERLARYLYLYAGGAATRDGAFSRLTEIAKRHLDPEREILNACVAMVLQPSEPKAATLCQLMREQGEIELALMLALALPADDAATRDLRLACTFNKRWWVHFGAILDEEPGDPVCQIWKAHHLWRDGQFEAARAELASAGDAGTAWLAHIDSTADARRKVVGGDAIGIVDWARCEATQPALKIWQTVSHERVASFQAGVTVRALEREKYFHAFIATPDQPLELDFASPRQLRVECRPLHDSDSTDPIEGWVFIDGVGARRKLPVITNYRSPGLEIVGRTHQQPGTLVWDEFAMGGWNTRLRIQPDHGSMIVRVLSAQPETHTGHLPPLSKETAAALFAGEDQIQRRREPGFGTVAVVDAQHDVTWQTLGAPYADPSARQIASVREHMDRFPPVAQPLPRRPQREAIERMTDWLWTREHDAKEKQREAIAAASAELDANHRFPELKRIHAKIVRRTFWEPLLTADQSAGLREIESAGWRPENPDLLTRTRLLSELGAHEQLISGTDSAVAMLTNKAENTVRLSLAMEVAPFLVPKPLRASVRLGDAPSQEVLLTSASDEKSFEFEVPPGQTSLRVDVLKSEPNHFLKVGIDAEHERELYERKTRRNYFVATAAEPLAVRIDGPAWVRIDQLDGETTRSEYRLVRDAVETLELSPSAPGAQALYRIHVLRDDEAKPYHPPAFTERSVETVAAPLTTQSLREPASLAAYDDEFYLGTQEDGTWTLGLSYNSRRAVEEDSFGGRGPERFWQGDITHRYYNEYLRTYFRTSLLGREREFGDETYGVEHSLQHRPFDHPLTYTLTGSAFWQDGEWALSGRGSISLNRELAPKWSRLSSISAFFRELSLDDAGAHPERIDQDIFTEFKSNHRRGLRLREEIAYAPWRDTRLVAGVGLGTNEDFNPFEPDSVNYSLGAVQLAGSVRLGATLRGYRFFADDDRSESVWRHRLQLEAVGEHWLRNQQRLEVGVSFTHFIEESENAFFLFGRWHFGEGRMLRDFRPGERPFSNARQRRIPHDRNNSTRFIHGRRFRGSK